MRQKEMEGYENGEREGASVPKKYTPRQNQKKCAASGLASRDAKELSFRRITTE